MRTLEEKLKSLPKQPGVYQYFDASGKLLYVGKAKNLANRVRSYFSFNPLRPALNLSVRITKMVQETASIEYIIVESEHDALLLENSLIKQLHPKYNILLRDDKTYPYIVIDFKETYPRVEITRKILSSKTKHYYGPFSIGANEIVQSVYEFCRLVQKKTLPKEKKACLFYQIQRCLAPCEFNVSQEEYDKELQLAIELIKDKKLLIQKLTQKMHTYAEALRFEEAGEIKERIEKIAKTTLLSSIDMAKKADYDIFVLAQEEKKAVVVMVFMRDGKIISSDTHLLVKRENFDEKEVLERAVLGFYGKKKPPVVAPILTNIPLDEEQFLQNYLSDLFEKKAQIITPKRGEKKKLVSLALLNAKEFLRVEKNIKEPLLEEIKQLCHLEHTPLRIECFDNSHLGGKAPVGAMVVFESGRFEKHSFRHYHLEAKDEYAQMRELLTRRAKSFAKNSPPDLWVIDGGSTLLKLALDIIQSSGANVDVIAIAKEKIDAKAHRSKGKAYDIIHTKEGELRLKPSDKRLQFIQRLRDEAHRFVITFHQKTKRMLDKESRLLQLQGISEAKVKKLLDYFGTFEVIKSATFEELSTILNTKDAKIIKKMY